MELSKDLHSKLCNLRDKQGNNVELEQIDSIISELIELFIKYQEKWDSFVFWSIFDII